MTTAPTGPDVAIHTDPTKTDLAISTEGLRKVFHKQRAVDGIDLAVPRGSVFGFLGPNGSGKTTTIRMLLGLSSATGGSIQVLGEPMPTALRSVLPGSAHSSRVRRSTPICRDARTCPGSTPPTRPRTRAAGRTGSRPPWTASA